MTKRGYTQLKGLAMKHWLFFGTLIIVTIVLLLRSRVSKTSTLTPSTTSPAMINTTFPATLPAGANALFPPQRTQPIPMH